MKFTIVYFLGLSVLLSGCSSTGLFILNSGLKIGADHDVKKDIKFGEKSWQKLDIYTPKTAPNKQTPPLPVLVFFYGGSWDSGKKEMYYFVANSFVKRGYQVVIPDYVKYPQGKFPDFMRDGAAAVHWVKDNISRYGGDADKMLVAGHSAGAHLGALMLTDKQYLAEFNIVPTDIKGFAGLAGPYNFTPTSRKMKAIFGPESNFPAMQTRSYVDGDEPPMLLLHGGKDDTVGVRNQEVLYEMLQQTGSKSIAKVYPDVGHIKILMSLTPPFNGKISSLDDMDKFFQQVLQ